MLTSRFPAIIAYSTGKVTRAVRRAEANIELRAKQRSRVDTGNMRGGWQTKSLGPFDGMVVNLVSYAIYNEYGTSRMPAQPMLRPAIEQTRPEFESDIKGAFL